MGQPDWGPDWGRGGGVNQGETLPNIRVLESILRRDGERDQAEGAEKQGVLRNSNDRINLRLGLKMSGGDRQVRQFRTKLGGKSTKGGSGGKAQLKTGNGKSTSRVSIMAQ